MNIRSWARAGALALAGAAVFGWGVSPAQAQASPSYALTLRGNIGGYTYGIDPGVFPDGCQLCDTDGCACLYGESGSSSVWKWNNNTYSNSSYVFELDYLDEELDSGTGNSCDPAIGEIEVTGVAGNTLYAETTGLLCQTSGDSDYATFTGSYVIIAGLGLYAAASGSGSVSLGIDSAATTFEAATNNGVSPSIYGQFQMTGNISLTTADSSCSVAGKNAC
ncbi:MAG: hypothetical protein ABSG46_08990 [Candidatus Binataceae bacterium]|jgi:hypothetical protein